MFRLVAGNLNYSSWTVRAWLALRIAGADFKLHDVGLFESPNWRDKIRQFSGAGKVPVLVDGSLSLHESLAICEYVAEKFPEAALWPREQQLRARARSISCEMLSGFPALRKEMPHNLRSRAIDPVLSPEVLAEVARVNDIWSASLEAGGGSYLFGASFTVADCMYMPVVSRFRTYGVTARTDLLSEASLSYCKAVLDHPIVLDLCSLAETTGTIERYDVGLRAP